MFNDVTIPSNHNSKHIAKSGPSDKTEDNRAATANDISSFELRNELLLQIYALNYYF